MSGDQLKIAFFGHFDGSNFGNESTLLAMLANLRRLVPQADFHCICTGPEATAATYNISAITIRNYVIGPWSNQSPLLRLARKFLIGIPSEICRWLLGFRTLWRMDALIVPGTGLLTDAYCFFNWGPYDMFRWSLTARLCGCKLLFVSVGAGPIHSRFGRFLVKAALSLANFRSYRDESSRDYLLSIGFSAENDLVYPDLAFSVPELASPKREGWQRPVVSIGLMVRAGRYSHSPSDAVHSRYLATLVDVMEWLLSRDYDVRLLIGDLADRGVIRDFKSMLAQRGLLSSVRVMDDPVESVPDLLSQIAGTDYVIATRFHNVLLSMLLGKPVMAISFHHKCSSLMARMGLSEYCEEMENVSAAGLIEQFGRLTSNADTIRKSLAEKIGGMREALDSQYRTVVRIMSPRKQPVKELPVVMVSNKERGSDGSTASQDAGIPQVRRTMRNAAGN